MSNKANRVDPLPESFSSYEEAGDFWDSHDTTDYLDDFEDEPVALSADFRRHRFEVEVEEELIGILRIKAREAGTSVRQLVGELLRRQLVPSA